MEQEKPKQYSYAKAVLLTAGLAAAGLTQSHDINGQTQESWFGYSKNNTHNVERTSQPTRPNIYDIINDFETNPIPGRPKPSEHVKARDGPLLYGKDTNGDRVITAKELVSPETMWCEGRFVYLPEYDEKYPPLRPELRYTDINGDGKMQLNEIVLYDAMCNDPQFDELDDIITTAHTDRQNLSPKMVERAFKLIHRLYMVKK